MQHVSAVAIFCEDIREEKSGQDTLVGTMPDNLNLASIPEQTAGAAPAGVVALPKLSLYLRINFDANDKVPQTVTARMINVDGNELAGSAWERSVIEKAFVDAKTNGTPLVGLIAKIVGGPFAVPRAGRVSAIVTIDGDDYIAGVLNVNFPSVLPQRV